MRYLEKREKPKINRFATSMGDIISLMRDFPIKKGTFFKGLLVFDQLFKLFQSLIGHFKRMLRTWKSHALDIFLEPV